jgi:D-glycero-beta-D-manno-heptose-7-phosphate kinase
MVVGLERLEEILDRATGVRIAVIGDLMLDEYLIGAVTRISPEAPVPVVQVSERRLALGGAGNVAANVSALGSSCEVVGFVGDDAAGAEVRRALESELGDGGSARLVERASRPTTTKTRVLARRQQVVRFDRELDSDLPEDCAEELVELVQQVVAGVHAIALEDYNKGVLVPRVIRTALELAGAARIPSVVDPKFRNFFEYRGATVFKPNALELATALAAPVHPEDDEQLESARRRVGSAHLLLTLGEDGMVLRSEESVTLRIPAFGREVYDVSGAGDTVTAVVAVALATGATVREAAFLANCAAAIEVTKPGVATVSPEELRGFIRELSVMDVFIA